MLFDGGCCGERMVMRFAWLGGDLEEKEDAFSRKEMWVVMMGDMVEGSVEDVVLRTEAVSVDECSVVQNLPVGRDVVQMWCWNKEPSRRSSSCLP